MAYINSFVTHFRELQAWSQHTSASVQLNVQNFEVEVKHRGRYYQLFPQFFGKVNGRFVNTPVLTPETTGFAGWLPYRLLRYELSNDKLYFKSFVRQAGLLTPAQWEVNPGGAPPDQDFILKRSVGSFGYELAGPFRAGTAPPPGRLSTGNGTLYAEQFVRGRALKVWYWGQRPFFAHVKALSQAQGDGSSTVQELVRRRLDDLGVNLDTYKERHVVEDCLAYQGLAWTDVPQTGDPVMVDYRYGREHSLRTSSLVSDNGIASLPAAALQALELAGARVAEKLRETLPAPVAYALDAVVDAQDRVWWLEANSNPTFPPEGYAAMFADLFGG